MLNLLPTFAALFLSSVPDPREGGLSLAAPAVPAALRDPAAAQVMHRDAKFMLGARAGFLEQKDAEDGAWFGGVQGRLFLNDYIGLEGSITFHQSEFLDDTVKVTQYPVQATALVFPFPGWRLQPYGLGGAGWYYTRTTYHDALSFLDTETDHTFGFHFGAGAEVALGTRVTANADIRYIFLDEPGVDNSQLEDEEWDFWQVTLAVNFGF